MIFLGILYMPSEVVLAFPKEKTRGWRVLILEFFWEASWIVL